MHKIISTPTTEKPKTAWDLIKGTKTGQWLQYPQWNPDSLTSEEIADRKKDGSINDFTDQVPWADLGGLTPLSRAMKRHNIDLVREVLAVEGADVTAPNKDGNPQLSVAAEHCPEALELLLDHKSSNPNIYDAFGYTILLNVLQFNAKYLDVMLKKKYKVDLDQSTEKEGLTPLLYSLDGKPDCAKKLLKAGADPNKIRSKDRLAPIFATAVNHPELIPVFFDHKVTPTPLQLQRCIIQSPKSIPYFIKTPQFSFHTPINDDGATALMYLVQTKSKHVLSIIKQEKIKEGLNTQDDDGRTVLFYAASNWPGLVIQLIVLGADEGHTDRHGKTYEYYMKESEDR